MKTTIALLASVALMTGCTIDRRTVVTETTPSPTTIQTPASSRQTNEDSFVEAIHIAHNGPVYVSDWELIDAGQGVCDGLESGATSQDMVKIAWDAADGDEDIYNLLIIVSAAAVAYFCPEYEYVITGAGL